MPKLWVADGKPGLDCGLSLPSVSLEGRWLSAMKEVSVIITAAVCVQDEVANTRTRVGLVV